MTPQRKNRVETVIAKRQIGLGVLLENVHDPHNIGAVMRSCDAVGISEIYILYTEERLIARGLEVGLNSASGSRKWVEPQYFTDVESCFKHIRKKEVNVLGTHLGENAKDLYDLNLTKPTVLVFGNEHRGISNEVLKHLDGNFIIPQFGMVQSLNISVACAVSLYEALRQRKKAGMYTTGFDDQNSYHKTLWDKYTAQHKLKEE